MSLNRIIIFFELVILVIFTNVIVIDWNQTPTTKDYFALLVIGEIGIELYQRLKIKTIIKNKTMSVFNEDSRVIEILSNQFKLKLIDENYLRLLLEENKIILEEFIKITNENNS
jgi:hypothetical protein